MMSAGSISNDCPMPYQLYRQPPRPIRPNSGYSWGKTAGSEVQKECAVCRRCMVSLVPSSPDWASSVLRKAIAVSRKRGSRSRRDGAFIISFDNFTPRRHSKDDWPASLIEASRVCRNAGGSFLLHLYQCSARVGSARVGDKLER